MFRKTINKYFLYIFFILILICSGVFAVSPEDKNSGAAILNGSGKNKYKSIRLVPEIYRRANRGLSDLRIKDDKNEDVPYFIYSGNQLKRETNRQAFMTLINSYTKDDSFYFDYRVRNIPESDILATSIEVTTKKTGFAKNIELYGSYDNTNWEFLQKDILYNVDNKIKLDIQFRKLQKFTHYRFKLGNNLEKIHFESVTLVHNYVVQENIYFIENILPAFNVTEEDRRTVVHIEGMRNLRLAAITIDTDSMFKRTVDAPFMIGGELYNLSFNDISFTDTTIPYNGQIADSDDFIITINNGDDKPINVNGISVNYYADELVFADNGSENYTLFFGTNDAVTAPVYDIARYKNEILKGDIDRLEIKKINLEVKDEESERYDFTVIFNIVVVAVAVLLGLLILLRLRKKM